MSKSYKNTNGAGKKNDKMFQFCDFSYFVSRFSSESIILDFSRILSARISLMLLEKHRRTIVNKISAVFAAPYIVGIQDVQSTLPHLQCAMKGKVQFLLGQMQARNLEFVWETLDIVDCRHFLDFQDLLDRLCTVDHDQFGLLDRQKLVDHLNHVDHFHQSLAYRQNFVDHDLRHFVDRQPS